MKRIADLRPLQQMTSLQELRIAFMPRISPETPQDPLNNTVLDQAVLRAIIECVPRSTTIRFDMDESSRQKLLFQLGPSVRYLFDKPEPHPTHPAVFAEAALRFINFYLESLCLNKGRLSGDTSDHSGCRSGFCRTQAACVNSRSDFEHTVLDPPEQWNSTAEQSAREQNPASSERSQKGLTARLKAALRGPSSLEVGLWLRF